MTEATTMAMEMDQPNGCFSCLSLSEQKPSSTSSVGFVLSPSSKPVMEVMTTHRRPFLQPQQQQQQSSTSSSAETTSMLVEEWNQLSFQERERVQEEVHGVATNMIDETPQLVQQKLMELDEEIRKVRRRNAYDRALFLSPTYVRNPAFRLIFLRADGFHPREAANRIVRFFEFKQELFGVGKLVKDIRLTDLEEEDRALYLQGTVRFLPKKDRTGRSVLCVYGKCHNALSQVRKLGACILAFR